MHGTDARPVPAPGITRVAVLGSVDDGKSTLVGRLLLDTGSVASDDLEAVRAASERRLGPGAVDLSLLTDGLEAEREQGITIDVAWRHIRTPRRRFLADAPGHAQYTRNAVTAASSADIVLLLVDAPEADAKGATALPRQTVSHAAAVALLRSPAVLLLVNKMDAAGFDHAVFGRIVAAFEALAGRLGLPSALPVPISALHGDNVARASARTPWYAGPTVLDLLQAHAPGRSATAALRLPVQMVLRPDAAAGRRERGYMGRIEAGTLRPGDRVVAVPGGAAASVRAIEGPRGAVAAAGPGLSVTVFLDDDVDVARGTVLAAVSAAPVEASAIGVEMCWFGPGPAVAGRRYLLKAGTATVPARLAAVEARRDPATGTWSAADGGLGVNDIARARLRLLEPLAVDPPAAAHGTVGDGAFILIDPESCATVAAGVVGEAA